MAATEERLGQKLTLERKLWWLILGRLAAALILMLVGVVWTGGTSPQPWGTTVTLLTVLIYLTIFYSLAHRFTKTLTFQAWLQFTVDIFLVTWLVWNSNVVYSPYTALYIVIIAISSVFLGRRGALVTSVASAVFFTGSALVAISGYGGHPAQALLASSMSQTIQSVGLFDVAFFVVGLLSGRLAEYQAHSDTRLIAAAQSLANLRAFHERIVESIRSGLITTDLHGRIFTFNAAAEEITGYEEQAVRGQDASIIFGDLTEHIKASMQRSSSRSTSSRLEADCLTSEGMRLRLGFSISPLFSETGETTGTIITFQDLTHIRALEETSRRQDQLAAVGRLAASIAHEIRNPLAAMRGSIQMLRHEMTHESSQVELMEIILRESDRLNRIITDFLTYARPRQASRSRVNVGDLMTQTFKLIKYSPEVGEKQTVETEVNDDSGLADADPEQLQQVFWNLARNALQAMPEGGTLRATLTRNSDNRLRIIFSDTGRGMTPTQVEHLFEPFSSTTGGTGLGLSIVYKIIRDHGGTINVSSREGQGTKISIELPAAEYSSEIINPRPDRTSVDAALESSTSP